jgi:hypothetical protein
VSVTIEPVPSGLLGRRRLQAGCRNCWKSHAGIEPDEIGDLRSWVTVETICTPPDFAAPTVIFFRSSYRDFRQRSMGGMAACAGRPRGAGLVKLMSPPGRRA